jgi:putative PIN family toxin of toxin-antitoxin system
VLDTNLVLSALVFGGGTPGALRRAWQQGLLTPLIATPTVAELLRTLSYPKFKLSAAEQEELLADYLPWCETVTIPDPPPTTPLCRDPFDQPFLQLAIAGKAQFLVTGDADLLILAPEFSPRIVTAAHLLESLELRE